MAAVNLVPCLSGCTARDVMKGFKVGWNKHLPYCVVRRMVRHETQCFEKSSVKGRDNEHQPRCDMRCGAA